MSDSYDVLLIIGTTTTIILLILLIIDSLTIQEIGEESVPCLDKYNRPFKDEMCIKKVECSLLGFGGRQECSQVKKIKT